MTETNRQWLFKEPPLGVIPGPRNFEYREQPVPRPGPGQFLVRNIYLSCDPAMQGWMLGLGDYMAPLKPGDVMLSGAIGQVVASDRDGYAEGDLVSGTLGWSDYFLSSGRDMNGRPVGKVPEGVALPDAMSVLGMTGLTAYFGLFDIGRPLPGDQVLVSGAAGAVGSIAGQLARIAGCRVVGIAGGDKKCRWVTEDLGFDACIDYKSEDVAARIAELMPGGIDVFFENVGGAILEAGLGHLDQGARVVLCGGISGYAKPQPGPANYMQLVLRRARMEGFIVLDYADRFATAIRRMAAWRAEGRLTSQVDVMDGFDKAPEALGGLFTGTNLGKRLVRIAPDPRVAN